ncbi:glutamate-1-semialdehyde 2,1-aminomutase [Balneolaceae bacterium ANBcel3]|nr:glutamate-1-semialdehyde 2,1-aminomutase [Balneolaceae bacterium ANBcel3]
MIISNSKQLFERARNVIPGGVNSPARAFKAVGGDPHFISHALGAHMYDVDGNAFIDYIGSWGPMILGHADPSVTKAIKEAAAHSSSFGAPSEVEVLMAEQMCAMVPGLEKVRMVNSGTEACMSAIRLARGFTKKEKIIKFEGCYHGHADSFLIKAGSGALTLGNPDSPGVTSGTAQDTLTASFNDLESVSELLQENKGKVAAIIVEPVAGNMGCVPPKEGFLEGLRSLCDEHRALLIFDEVMTGFRIAKGGAVERFGVRPDLMTYGKVMGAGMPVGAFGGRREVMQMVAPEGPVYQAGTLSGNPVAMSAGLALLRKLDQNPATYDELEVSSAMLEDGLRKLFKKYHTEASLNRVGSMLGVFFCTGSVETYTDVKKTDTSFFSAFFREMLKEGVYLPPSAYEAWFVSSCHNSEIIQNTLDAAEKVLKHFHENHG